MHIEREWLITVEAVGQSTVIHFTGTALKARKLASAYLGNTLTKTLGEGHWRLSTIQAVSVQPEPTSFTGSLMGDNPSEVSGQEAG
jgi:hypothetical protein